MKKFLSLVLSMCMLMSLLSVSAFADDDDEDINVAGDPQYSYNGIWEGMFPVFAEDNKYYNDKVTMDIDMGREMPILLKINSMGIDNVYIPPKVFSVDKDKVLTMEIYDDGWASAATFKFETPYQLKGKYKQKGHEMDISFKRVSGVPSLQENLNTTFLHDGKSGQEWQEELKKYPEFKKTGITIPFTYDLNNTAKSRPLINMYGLDKIMAESKTDVDTMIALMDVMNRNFKHDGLVALTDRMDPLSVIALHNEKGGVECRGLAIILSEMLRTCGVPAKPIMCISPKEPAECHVVVHAYSKELNQWIMLDPTYHLMLKDKDGKYVDLPSLRNILMNDEPLFANEEANYNGTPVYMPSYRGYMTKNTFRFASATNFYFGGERFADTDVKGDIHVDASSIFGETASQAALQIPKANNPFYMLVPAGFNVPYAYSRSEIITTDADAFWALPNVSPIA